jgi:hypothetical protein
MPGQENLNYTVSKDNRFNIWMDLKSNQSTIIAFAPEGFFGQILVPPVHVVKTNVPDLRFSSSKKTVTARGYPGNTTTAFN